MAGGAGEVVQDDVGLHDGQAVVAQRGNLTIAVDGEIVGLLLHAVLEVDGAEAERHP